ncbi:CsgG/HfaB family protein [Alkalispirochaeta alkalica]|uniref:CsgG/HfaB family protein n=1 Tax=Alkalispirochaeta alkalica TaxID=46356 RepID=UPI0003601EDF|nr:CsgG/HfaB family protein [Alkalispirochaeta alkalica]
MKAILIFTGLCFSFLACQTAPDRAFSGDEPREPTLSGVLVVNYFENTSSGESDLDWLSRSVTDFLISELTALDFVRVVSRQEVRTVLQEQEFSALSGLTEETIERGRMLSADYILSGDYYEQEGQIFLNARLLDAETAETLRSFHLREPRQNIYAMQERLLYDFLRFSNVNLSSSQLAARDYEPDATSMERFYRAEELIEQNQDQEARELLERLLAENRLFTPAREQLEELQPSPGGGIDGSAAIAAADAEVRRRLRYRNLTSSFIAYSQAQAYRVEYLGEPHIESRDGEHFGLALQAEMVVRDEYLDFLEDFIQNHAYISESDRRDLLQTLRDTRRARRRDPRAFPRSLQIRFTDTMIETDNYFGFAKISLEDREGDLLWELYSTRTRNTFSPRYGEFPPARETGLAGYGQRIETLGHLNLPYYAFFGTTNARGALSNSLWLTQPRIIATILLETRSMNPHTGVIEFGLGPEHDELLAGLEGLSRRDMAEFGVFFLTRDEIARLGNITVTPYFIQTRESRGE